MKVEIPEGQITMVLGFGSTLLCVGLLHVTKSSLHIQKEGKNETDLGEWGQTVPMHLGFFRSKVVIMQANAQIPDKTHRQIEIFINSHRK